MRSESEEYIVIPESESIEKGQRTIGDDFLPENRQDIRSIVTSIFTINTGKQSRCDTALSTSNAKK